MLKYIEDQFAPHAHSDEAEKWLGIINKLPIACKILDDAKVCSRQEWANRIIAFKKKMARASDLDGYFNGVFIYLHDYIPHLMHPLDSFLLLALATSVGVVLYSEYEELNSLMIVNQ